MSCAHSHLAQTNKQVTQPTDSISDVQLEIECGTGDRTGVARGD